MMNKAVVSMFFNYLTQEWPGRRDHVGLYFTVDGQQFDNFSKLHANMGVAQGSAVFNSPIFENNAKAGPVSVTLCVYR